MSISRSQLGRGPAHVIIGGVTLFTRADMVPRMSPVWNPVPTSMFGNVDRFLKDRVYKLGMRLWGAWENLSTCFPSYAMTPQAGTSIFGVTDQAVAILARNGDKITYTNMRVTKLMNLYLGVDSELFAADMELTGIIGNNVNPEDANAYYTLATAQSYADSAFAKTNFKRVRFSGAWGALTGFTTITPQKGFHVSFNLDAKPVPCDGLGTVDFTVGENTLQGECKCIPIGPTLAQIEAQASAQGKALGSLLSTNVADLTLAGSGISVVLKNAGILEHGYAFGAEPLRVGEMAWGTTQGFTAGAPQAIGTVG
jgi:hypothetical protein